MAVLYQNLFFWDRLNQLMHVVTIYWASIMCQTPDTYDEEKVQLKTAGSGALPTVGSMCYFLTRGAILSS